MHLMVLFFHNGVALTFISLCSSYNEDWLNFPELSELPESCKPKTCFDVDTKSLPPNGVCDCDARCVELGTCCIDSPYTTLSSSKSFKSPEQCYKVEGSNIAVFMVSTCNPKWRGPRMIRELCQRVKPNNRDPLTTIPVTNPQSNITYKNFFCSLCNFNDQGETVLWDIILEFKQQMPYDMNTTDTKNIISRMEYSINTWGIWNTDSNNTMEFVPIAITTRIPLSFIHAERRCDPSLVSTCSTKWENVIIKSMCEAYLSPLTLLHGEKATSVTFRNAHCAMCNHATNYLCIEIFTFEGIPPSLSFTILLDVNPSDGSKVGETNSCKRNEVFDPFFQKCRALVCAVPGYVVKNEQCVRN